MVWHRWSDWTKDDPRWSTYLLDTTGQSVERSVEDLERWIYGEQVRRLSGANRVVGHGGGGDDLRMRSAEFALDQALLRLADVLAGVTADISDCCGHCYSEQDGAALAGPVDAIPADLLSSVAFDGPDHWDDFANLYKKLTPRIMASIGP